MERGIVKLVAGLARGQGGGVYDIEIYGISSGLLLVRDDRRGGWVLRSVENHCHDWIARHGFDDRNWANRAQAMDAIADATEADEVEDDLRDRPVGPASD